MPSLINQNIAHRSVVTRTRDAVRRQTMRRKSFQTSRLGMTKKRTAMTCTALFGPAQLKQDKEHNL